MPPHPPNPSYFVPRSAPLPDDVDSYIAFCNPKWSPQQRREAFDRFSAACEDGAAEAVQHYRISRAAVEAGNVFGLEKPPLRAHVTEVSVGPLAIFYHPGPNHLDLGAPFVWSAYIGLAGQGQRSIIPTADWDKHRYHIRVEIMHNSNWEACRMLLVTPLTRARLTYNDLNGQRTTEEIIFPPSPRSHTPSVRYLQ
ncbi:hypothetical protein C8R47DRAFT_1151032 [Mycena vitilis]|nr:hypothetical protein C8R47DRAFT_1151032 [Mycena vitilis]